MMDDSPLTDRQPPLTKQRQERTHTPPELSRPTKKLASDLSYIKNWNPRPVGSASGGMANSTPRPVAAGSSSSATTRTSLETQPSPNALNPRPSVTDVYHHPPQDYNRYPSPKHQQSLDGFGNSTRYLDTSPLSASSVSSSSSPSIVESVPRDPFASLSSKFVVRRSVASCGCMCLV